MQNKHVHCATKGWFFVRFKCSLHEDERSTYKLAQTFEDWAFYDGEKWDVDDILYFHIIDVLKAETKDDDRLAV